MITIQIINQSTCVADADLAKIAAALQTQVTRDFAPEWQHEGAKIRFVPKGAKPLDGAWPLYVRDNSDQQGALGYHELLAGLPDGYVFAEDDLKYGSSLSVTISHELLEMLADPEVNRVAQAGNRFYALEDCDAVEADQLGYEIDGVLVSDFVLPTWFVPGVKGPYDFCNHVQAPLQVLHGGYIGYLDLSAPQAGWQDVTADGHCVADRKRPGSRYHRRRQKLL